MLGGIVLAAVGDGSATVGLGVGLTGCGMIVALVNVLAQLANQSQADREREHAARAFFDRHGRWPGKRDRA